MDITKHDTDNMKQQSDHRRMSHLYLGGGLTPYLCDEYAEMNVPIMQKLMFDIITISITNINLKCTKVFPSFIIYHNKFLIYFNKITLIS